MKTRQLLNVIGIFIVVINSVSVTAQSVQKFTINNKTYYGTKAIPEEIKGYYQYEKTKQPIVEINEDGMGQFQKHGVKAYPVEYWVQTDENGVIQKVKSEDNNNYQVVLILLYGSNGETGWRGESAGTYDRIEATVAYDQGYVIILGERFKKIN